jgi:hypothetical protein
MTLQNQEFGDSRVNPLQPGVSGAAARVPDGGSFEKGSGDGARKKRKNPRFQSVSEMSLRKLKRLHGESQGRNLAVEEELRRRGFNAQMLKESEWQHAQQRWEKTIRQSGHAAGTGTQGKEDELAKWRRLPIRVRSTTDDHRDAPDRRSKRQRRFERRLEKRRQEREAGLRPRKK